MELRNPASGQLRKGGFRIRIEGAARLTERASFLATYGSADQPLFVTRGGAFTRKPLHETGSRMHASAGFLLETDSHANKGKLQGGQAVAAKRESVQQAPPLNKRINCIEQFRSMKRILLAIALLSCMVVSAQEFETNPSGPGPECAAAGGDCMPTFMRSSSKESLALFSSWFRNAYLREFKLYKKRNKGTYQYHKDDFQSVLVSFMIDTTGRPRLMGTRPELLSGAQSEVLRSVFDRCPSWTPAMQNGRKVRFKYTLPVNE